MYREFQTSKRSQIMYLLKIVIGIILHFLAKGLKIIAMNSDFVLLFFLSSRNYLKIVIVIII